MAPHAALVAKKLGRKAALAIVAGSDAQSQRFVQIKQHLLANVSIRIEPIWLNAETESAQAVAVIGQLNLREDLDGIFLQFPLPAAIDPQVIADAVDPNKDIDCSGSLAEAQFEQAATPFTPVAPAAACLLLEDALGSVARQQILIYGAADAFARGLRVLLERGEANVRIVTPGASDLVMGEVDALVVTESVPPIRALADAESVSVILDAGYYLPPRARDWLPPSIFDRVGVLLKQYGNVGPLTVANLARATVRAAKRRVSLGS